MINVTDFADAERVFYYFEQISKIPRGSGNCKQIADYLAKFAKSHGLYFLRDEADNVLIRKPATAGYETHPTVIIQGHTDMVAEKTPECNIDMLAEGLKIYRDGDYITADGTTLGGDDGIAVAYALAILERDDLSHPELEVLMTSDEEIGLIGAGKFDTSVLHGKVLINVDSEEEGIFTVGCAGGARVDMSLLDREPPITVNGAYKLRISGLLGGHSGVEIDKGRANAAKLLSEVLIRLPEIRLVSFIGGRMDNAIMRDCEAVFASKESYSVLSGLTSGFEAEYKAKYCSIDDGVTLTLTALEGEYSAFSEYDTGRIISLIDALPFGVLKMSEDIKGLPESSANVGVVRIGEGHEYVTSSIRSSKLEGIEMLKGTLEEAAKQFGFDISYRGEYPAWEYKPSSPLRDTAVRLYRELYGNEPTVLTIHAGLECGILSAGIVGLDCISIGPNMKDIHTTEEMLSISSSARVYQFLIELLARL